MIYNKHKEVFEYEGKSYIIGEEIYAVSSAYKGLLGRITEIRTGDDRETENEEPDIYCDFYAPVLEQEKQSLKQVGIKPDEIGLDGIIMAPEMIITLRSLNEDFPQVSVFALIEDCSVDGEDHSSVRLFTTSEHAEIAMKRSITFERISGCIKDWLDNSNYLEEQDAEYHFSAFIDMDYISNHYTTYIEKLTLIPSMPFVEQMLNIGLEVKRREDVAEQIESWSMSDNVRRNVIYDKSLYVRTMNALEQKDGYNESYWEAISEVAHELVAEHKNAEKILQIAKKEGKI